MLITPKIRRRAHCLAHPITLLPPARGIWARLKLITGILATAMWALLPFSHIIPNMERQLLGATGAQYHLHQGNVLLAFHHSRRLLHKVHQTQQLHRIYRQHQPPVLPQPTKRSSITRTTAGPTRLRLLKSWAIPIWVPLINHYSTCSLTMRITWVLRATNHLRRLAAIRAIPMLPNHQLNSHILQVANMTCTTKFTDQPRKRRSVTSDRNHHQQAPAFSPGDLSSTLARWIRVSIACSRSSRSGLANLCSLCGAILFERPQKVLLSPTEVL